MNRAEYQRMMQAEALELRFGSEYDEWREQANKRLRARRGWAINRSAIRAYPFPPRIPGVRRGFLH